jgi:hypothetical protein
VCVACSTYVFTEGVDDFGRVPSSSQACMCVCVCVCVCGGGGVMYVYVCVWEVCEVYGMRKMWECGNMGISPVMVGIRGSSQPTHTYTHTYIHTHTHNLTCDGGHSGVVPAPHEAYMHRA